MNFNTFALLALLAPVAVQSHATEVHYCITSDTDPQLRIFVEHWHQTLSLTADPSDAGTLPIEKNNESPINVTPDNLIWDVSSDNLGQQGCQGNSTTLVTSCKGASDCPFFPQSWCEESYGDWAVFDRPLTCDVQVKYQILSSRAVFLQEACTTLFPATITVDFPCPPANPSASPSVSPSVSPSANPSASPSVSPSTSPSVSPSANPSASPSNIPSEFPSEFPSDIPSDSPSDQPSLVPSRSSKKGKKDWRAERLARDPNFPTFAPKKAKKGKIGHVHDGKGSSTKAPKSSK